MIICQTERFYLRPFIDSDLNLLYQLHSDPQVAKTTIDGIQNLEMVKKHLAGFIVHQDKFGFAQWAVFEKETDKFVGRAGLVKRALNQEVGEQIEIRFAFLPEFWGQGVASEISADLVAFAKEKLKLKKIVAANAPTNDKSSRVLLKNGFVHIKNIIPEGYGSKHEIKYWELEF